MLEAIHPDCSCLDRGFRIPQVLKRIKNVSFEVLCSGYGVDPLLAVIGELL
jgi:hypothetical protein